ncbi:MAG: hypothetical protein ACKO9H_11525, partial [Planctomycetota bacterium]
VSSTFAFDDTKPAVVSATLKYRRPKVLSYFFEASPELLARNSGAPRPRKPTPGPAPTDVTGEPATDSTSSGDEKSEAPAQTKKQHTRIKPPGDVVKLSDRLFYLLQPPLEYLLAGNTME